jgi:hypothetical protein
VPVLRTETDRAEGTVPDSERDSRPETERREIAERDEREEERDDARDDAPDEPRDDPRDEACAEPLSRPLSRSPLVMPVGGEESVPVGETTGARPQWSQYSSPPPMSS